MSSRGRGSEVEPNEFYSTPAWCVHRLLDRIGERIGFSKHAGIVAIEPAIGRGAILVAVAGWMRRRWGNFMSPVWFGFDVVEPTVPANWESFASETYVGSFMSKVATQRSLFTDIGAELAITNPPFSLALDMARAAMQVAPVVIQLSRIGWLGSNDRADWLRANTPSVYLLPDRPSFVGKGRTDSDYYAWMVWWDEPPKFEILDSTPLEERKAEYEAVA